MCAITQCVACLTYIDVALARINTEEMTMTIMKDVGQSYNRLEEEDNKQFMFTDTYIKQTPARSFTLKYSM